MINQKPKEKFQCLYFSQSYSLCDNKRQPISLSISTWIHGKHVAQLCQVVNKLKNMLWINITFCEILGWIFSYFLLSNGMFVAGSSWCFLFRFVSICHWMKRNWILSNPKLRSMLRFHRQSWNALEYKHEFSVLICMINTVCNVFRGQLQSVCSLVNFIIE